MLGIETIKITPEIMRRCCDIDEFKGLWTGLENHTTGLNLLGDVATFGAGFKKLLGPLEEREFDADVVRLLHGAVTGTKKPSEYKTEDNQLTVFKDGDLVGFLDTASPEQVPKLVAKLLEWTNDALPRDDMHPLLVIAVFTAVFLQISPFSEGNQKLARLLITLLMLKSGYSYAPYVLLERVMNEQAATYFRALKNNQQSLEVGRPDWSEWIKCFLMLLQGQKDELYRRFYDEEKELSHLPTLSARIMALFQENERLQMKEIIKQTNGRRSTIKLRIGELVEEGYLKRHGKARSTWYALN